MYNTDNLSFGYYNYNYILKCDNNDLLYIYGQRKGLIYILNGECIDLITGFNLTNDDFIGELNSFKLKGINLTKEEALHIFKSLENNDLNGYEGKEWRVPSEDDKLVNDVIPIYEKFKPSEHIYYFQDIYNDNKDKIFSMNSKEKQKTILKFRNFFLL